MQGGGQAEPPNPASSPGEGSVINEFLRITKIQNCLSESSTQTQLPITGGRYTALLLGHSATDKGPKIFS